MIINRLLLLSDHEHNFQEFKLALRNFEETEHTRTNNENSISVIKTKGGRLYSNNNNNGGYNRNNNVNTNRYRNQKNNFVCYACGEAGHKANDCRQSEDDLCCKFCKTSGHSDKACRKQSKEKIKKVDVNKNTEHSYAFKISDDYCLETDDTEKFLVDCGATTHIVNVESNFIYVDDSFIPEDHYIELADGTRDNNVAKKKGTVEVALTDDNRNVVKVTLENTLFIPTYPQCIFSVQTATQKGAQLTFDGNSAQLISKNSVCFPIKQCGRLYYLYKCSSKAVCSYSLQTWHQILGHCNQSDVLKLENVVSGMKITDKNNFTCETCILGKQVNIRNKEPDVRANSPFELIHRLGWTNRPSC